MCRKYFLAVGLLISIGAFADEAPGNNGQWAQKRQEFKTACGGDLESLCGAAKGPAKFKCLKQNEQAGKLSPTCTKFLAEHHHHGAPEGAPPPASGGN